MDKLKNLSRNQKIGVAVLAFVIFVVVVVLIVLAIGYFSSPIYRNPEVFQVSLAGTGYGDPNADYNEGQSDAIMQSVADDLSAQFGTTYTPISADQVRSYTDGTEGQWCNPGWVTGDSWPYCQSADDVGDPTCCSGIRQNVDWHGLSPQPAVFLYGQKPKKGQMPLCSDTSLTSGTQCISNWSSGGGLPTVYSMHD